MALDIAGPGRPRREERHRSELPQRGHPHHGERRALHEHVPLAGGGDRRGDGTDDLGVRPPRLRARDAHQQRVAASRGRVLAGWRRRARHHAHRPRLHDRARRPDRPSGGELRRQGLGRPQPGPGAARRRALALRQHVAAGDRARRRRGRVVRPGLPAAQGDAAGRRARVRRPHRPEALDLPRGARARRGRARHVERRLLEDHGRRQRLDAHERRRGAGVRVPAVRDADQRLLRRRPPRRQPLRRVAGLRGRAHRPADLAPADRPTRPLGLRPARRAEPDRRHRGWPARQGRGPGDQAGVRVRVRSGDGRPALADRGPPRPAVERARREVRRHPAVPHEAGPGRDPGGARGRPDRRDAGAPPARRSRSSRGTTMGRCTRRRASAAPS